VSVVSVSAFFRRVAFVGAMVGLWAASAAAVLPPHAPGRLLVQPKPNVTEAAFNRIVVAQYASQIGVIRQINVRVLHVPEARLEVTIAGLRHNPNIAFVEPDYLIDPALVPNDPYYSSEWHLAKIQAPQAWDITTGSNSVIIAVLDTGVDGTQPDLAGKLVPGWNFYDDNSDTSDPNGHGTAVAGTAAAASNNGTGVASLAWGCLIMPIRVSDTNGVATTSTIGTALTWAADHGARVANISFAVFTNPTVTSAAQYFQSKGGVTAVSAGNNGKYYTNADNIYMLTVSATDSNDALASWSNTGNFVDLAAPGVGILTTGLGGGYVSGSGTSFSAPVVAGVAALVMSLNPSLSGTDVRTLLEQSADDLGSAGWDPSYGYGRVNAYKAVLAAGGAPPDTIPPTASFSSPTNGASVSGSISVAVTGTDNVGVTKLEWYLDGVLQGSNNSASASFSWNTATAANGSHTLQAKAYDAAGNSGTSSLISVSVNNSVPSPTASISSPSSGSTVSNSVSVDVVATDTVTITNVQWYLDGALQESSASATPNFSWNTTNCANGSHTLQAEAYDAAGSMGASALVSVTVQNSVPDTTPPTVAITSPASGFTVTARYTPVSVASSDNVGVVKVAFLVDGKTYATSTSSTPVFNWYTAKLVRGSHTLQAVASDAAGNSTRSAVATVSK
jgi:subtilisin family serine protease